MKSQSFAFLIYCYIADICQLRLDFDMFNIMGPSDTIETNGGQCQDDTFVVSQSPSTNAEVPILCGDNTGQHSMLPLKLKYNTTTNLMAMKNV